MHISPSYHLFYNADNIPVLSLRRNTEHNPSCALCLQSPPQAAWSHDYPCSCQTCFRITYLPANLGLEISSHYSISVGHLHLALQVTSILRMVQYGRCCVIWKGLLKVWTC